jgi:hypothetical protein
VTLSHLRRILHAELRHVHAEFQKHVRKHMLCHQECAPRARFQERIRTLNFALEQAGGRKMDESYSWGPVEGA